VNLLHVSAGYPPFLGGAETYAQVISERLVATGHLVTFVASNAAEVEYYWNPRKRYVSPGQETLNGVRVIRCRISHLPFSPWSFYGFRRLATLLARCPVRTAPLLHLMAPYMPGMPDICSTLAGLPGPYDLVHGINIALEWPVLAAWRYARRNGVPFVITPFVHVGEHGKQDVLIHYVMPHQLDVLRDADAVFVQTDIEKATLAQLGLSEARMHRLGMGVDLHRLGSGDALRFRSRYHLSGEAIVTFLGVVTRDKGSFDLVRAMERLWARGVKAYLVIAGPVVDEFRRFYATLSPSTRARIVLTGPVQGQDKWDLLTATTVLALPSRIDSFGIVYLEAWAYGKPVVGARAGGVPDVIEDGMDGRLVRFGDVDNLAAVLSELLADPLRAQAMGERGRTKVEAWYTWEHVYARLMTVYERLVKPESRRGG